MKREQGFYFVDGGGDATIGLKRKDSRTMLKLAPKFEGVIRG